MERAERLWLRLPYAVRFALGQIVCAALGCALAGTRLFGGLPSQAIAFVAAAEPGCLTASCVGAIAGALLSADDLLSGWTAVAALLCCGVISFSLRRITRARETPAAAAGVAALCTAATGFTTLLAGGFYLSGVLLLLCDSIVAAGCGFFCARCFTLRRALRRTVPLDEGECLSLLAGLCVLLPGFCVLHVYLFVPARAAAALLVLLAGALFWETGGGVAGLLCGGVLEIACAVPGLACCMGMAGLLGGLLGRRHRLLIPAGFTLTALLFPLLTQQREAVAVFAECAAAAGLFCAVPSDVLQTLRRMFGGAALPTEKQNEGVRLRLRAAARAVSDITPALTQQMLRQGKVPGTAAMIRRVREIACADCAGADECWKNPLSDAEASLREAFASLHDKQFLDADALPGALGKTCRRRNMLCAACIQAYEENTQSPYAHGGVPEWIGADPFSPASDLLADAADSLPAQRQTLPTESAAAGRILRSYGVPVRSVVCTSALGRRSLAVVTDPLADPVRKSALTRDLGNACGCTFDMPTIRASGETIAWHFAQSVRFCLRTGTAQRAADGKCCGDFFLTFAREGKQTFLLCDGMGTGADARADAETTADIFASLLQSGLSFGCALRTVNTALLLREDTESVCTLDALQIDLYAGTALFCKAGAAPSYLAHKGRAERIELPCMPIGILPDAAFRETKRTLRKGDVLLLASDGACAMRDAPITEALCGFDGGSAQALARRICDAAAPGELAAADDRTALVIVVE